MGCCGTQDKVRSYVTNDFELLPRGEPLTYDKSFKGPREKRSCTDVPCLLVFVAFLAGWGYVAYYAIQNGDLNTLLVPTDSLNHKCGVDSSVINKPYLFFFNLQKCFDPLVPINGCPTPQVCVEQCPTETFVFDDWKGSNIADLKNKLICTSDVNKDTHIRTWQDAKNLVDKERCARWYVKSKPFLKRCIWESSSICQISSSIYDRNRRETHGLNEQHQQQNNTFQFSKLVNSNNNSNSNLNNNNNDKLEFSYDEIIPPPLAIMLDKAAKQYLPDDQLQIYDQQRTINEPKFQCDRRTKLGEQIIVQKMRRTDTYISRFTGNFIAHFYNGTDAQELAQKVVEDIFSSWLTICMALILAMLASLIFIALMRWLAAPMVWLSLIGVTAALGYGIYRSIIEYNYWKNTETVPHHSPNLASTLQNLIEDEKTWLYISIGLSVAFVVIILIIIVLRKRIVLAIALIKEGSKAVATMFSTVFFPIFPWILHIAAIAFAITIGLYLASIGEPVFKVLGPINDVGSKCICNGGNTTSYKTGSSCNPQEFNRYCSQDGIPGCVEAGCYFDKIKSPKLVGYFHGYNVVGFFWLVFFISAFGEMVLAATFASWYWTFHKSEVPYFILTKAFIRTIRYHLGTIAIGSLLVTICRLIRIFLEYIHSKLKKYDNELTRCLLCCMRCFFWCLENFLRFLNKNAYIMCAIHGKNFCTSAKDAFNLLMRNVLRVVTIDKVTDFVFFMSKILLTMLSGAGIYFYLLKYSEFYQLHYLAVPTTIVVIGTYLITTVFFGVYSMAIDTLFLCFLEDSERNDGSPEKPYFMSKRLMKILGKSNEIPRNQYN